MSDSETDEQHARKLLEQYKVRNLKPGQSIEPQALVSSGMSGSELEAGIRYCGQQGWLENSRDKSISLTKAGFDQL